MTDRDTIPHELIAIAQSIDYQEGAVVSSTVLKRDSGSVTLFAFDQAQGLSEHTTPHDALVQIVEGRAEISISGRAHVVSQGEMIHLPAGEPHALKAVSRFKMVLVMLKA
jgi:quercetin dioxygenase-like cupin family protein